MKRTYKRRNIFINKDFQGKLILGYFLFAAGGCLLFIFLLAVFSADTLTISYNNNDLQLGQTPFMLAKKILAANWILIVFGTIFLVLASMLITFRIAGPMFRIDRALNNMLQRKLNDTIYLRGKDEGKDLAKKINDFNADLSKTIGSIRSESNAIAEYIKQQKTDPQKFIGGDADALQSVFLTLEEKNRHIETICSSYVLKDE